MSSLPVLMEQIVRSVARAGGREADAISVACYTASGGLFWILVGFKIRLGIIVSDA